MTDAELLSRAEKALEPFAKAAEATLDYPDSAACLRAAFDWFDKRVNARRSATVLDLKESRAVLALLRERKG